MKSLIVGAGAIGGTVAARGIAAGMDLRIATRTEASAATIRKEGARVSGVGGSAHAVRAEAAPLGAWLDGAERFDLILLATKAREALEIAPRLSALLTVAGAIVPIQNGGVSQLVAARIGAERVVGGLSNLGATAVSPGVYEQRNAGHLLIGELGGGASARVSAIAAELGRAVETRTTANLAGAVWSKLLLNCSVTTLGALAGQSMRQYVATDVGRKLFRAVYDETLAVAEAAGVRPERMLVEPVPPGWNGAASATGPAYDAWIGAILASYGDLKASMLQDFERGRPTEIDFINGYVAEVAAEKGVSARLNRAVTAAVHRIERGEATPSPDRLRELAGEVGY